MAKLSRIQRVNKLIIKCKTSKQLVRVYDYIDLDGDLFETVCWELWQLKSEAVMSKNYLSTKWSNYVELLHCIDADSIRIKHAVLKVKMLKEA